MKKKIICLLLAVIMCLSTMVTLTSCTAGAGDEAFVIMIENLDGLFNPFFSTSANDGTIVAMTQIGMLSSKLDENGQVVEAFGENESTVTLDFEQSELNENNETVYTFVIKNGVATIWGLGTGNTYYIKETGPPNVEGYGLTQGVIRLTIGKCRRTAVPRCWL